MSYKELILDMEKSREEVFTCEINIKSDTYEYGYKLTMAYYNQLISKYLSIECLLKSDCVDTINIVVRSYLENYGILLDLIANHNQKEEISAIINKLTRTQISQSMAIVGSPKPSNFILYLKTYYKFLIIPDCDPDSMSDEEVLEVAEKIKKDCWTRRKNKSINSLVTEILNKSDFIKGDMKFLYPYLCIYSHANPLAVIKRSYDKKGNLSMNFDNFDLNYIITLVIKCLEDASAKMRIYFNDK